MRSTMPSGARSGGPSPRPVNAIAPLAAQARAGGVSRITSMVPTVPQRHYGAHVLRVGADEFAARCSLLDDPFDGEPLVLLDGEVPDGADARLAGVPVVVVGVDVEPRTDDELAAIERAVSEHPDAAVALTVLLRGARHRSIAEGLAAESATYSMLQAGADHQRWLADRAHREGRRDVQAASPVAVTRTGPSLRITLIRPDRHNAFSARTRDALAEALAVAVADPTLDVIIEATGASFCSGGDLDEFGTATDPAAAHVVRLRRSVGRMLAAIAERVTVHVHGACAGAGMELPAFAGRVVARADARFWLPEVSMGLIPGAGGTVSIPRRIGRRRTALLALTGRAIDAATACEWGLVDDVVT